MNLGLEKPPLRVTAFCSEICNLASYFRCFPPRLERKFHIKLKMSSTIPAVTKLHASRPRKDFIPLTPRLWVNSIQLALMLALLLFLSELSPLLRKRSQSCRGTVVLPLRWARIRFTVNYFLSSSDVVLNNLMNRPGNEMAVHDRRKSTSYIFSAWLSCCNNACTQLQIETSFPLLLRYRARWSAVNIRRTVNMQMSS
jgi:hypothetical protein